MEEEEKHRLGRIAEDLMIGASNDPKIFRMVQDEVVERGYSSTKMRSTSMSFKGHVGQQGFGSPN